jgi:hypothetical protein
MKQIIAAAGLLALAGCSSDQLGKFTAGAAKVEPALQSACDTAVALSTVAGLVPGVGAIVPYISVACRTAEGFAKLAADPSSAEWLGQLSGQIKGLAAAVGKKL